MSSKTTSNRSLDFHQIVFILHKLFASVKHPLKCCQLKGNRNKTM